MQERIIAALVGELADFMADCYGRVQRNGSTWIAADGGAQFKVSTLTESEAVALDCAARKFAYPDAREEHAMEAMTEAYKALRDFDNAMDTKYQRDPSSNRMESLSLPEMQECRRLGIARDVAARSCSESDYASVVAAYNEGVRK
jgi:hypothetical protein